MVTSEQVTYSPYGPFERCKVHAYCSPTFKLKILTFRSSSPSVTRCTFFISYFIAKCCPSFFPTPCEFHPSKRFHTGQWTIHHFFFYSPTQFSLPLPFSKEHIEDVLRWNDDAINFLFRIIRREKLMAVFGQNIIVSFWKYFLEKLIEKSLHPDRNDKLS